MQKIMFNDRYGLTQAVIEGRKTETRRIELKDDAEYIARHWNPKYRPKHCYYRDARGFCQLINSGTDEIFIPRYKLCETVAVAQSYMDAGYIANRYKALADRNYGYISGNGINEIPMPWPIAGATNKMFVRADLMPHQIIITGIRVERLQEITDEDCLREGIEFSYKSRSYYVDYRKQTGRIAWLGRTPREAFAALIDKVSGRGTWESNPYVVVYEFELVK